MKLFFQICIALLLIFAIVPNVSAQYTATEERFQAGDAVQIQMWQSWEKSEQKTPISNLSGNYVINANGDIFMPFVGMIKVVRRTPDEVAQIVEKKYEGYLSKPFIYIRPLIRLSLRGSVQRPGSYRIDPKSSLWELISQAGGQADDADFEKMFVLRDGERVIKDLLKAFEKAHTLNEVGIRSGDQIVLPQTKSFSFRTLVSYLNFGVTLVWMYLRITDNR